MYAGLRPLLKGATEPTSKISREHTVAAPVRGLVMIAGGKLTTYRVMARDAVDAAAKSLEGEVGPSITHRVPLLGASGFEARTNQRVALARSSGLDIARIDHLLGRFGGLIDEVLELIANRPELGEPLAGAEDYLAAEVVYAVTHEGARHLDDVLARRTRISIETFDRGTLSARRAAELMGGELGWDERAPRGRGRPLPAPRRGGAAEPGEAHRPGGRRGPGQGARGALGRLITSRQVRTRPSDGSAAKASNVAPAPTPLTNETAAGSAPASANAPPATPSSDQDPRQHVEEPRAEGPAERHEVHADDDHHPRQAELLVAGVAQQQRPAEQGHQLAYDCRRVDAQGTRPGIRQRSGNTPAQQQEDHDERHGPEDPHQEIER